MESGVRMSAHWDPGLVAQCCSDSPGRVCIRSRLMVKIQFRVGVRVKVRVRGRGSEAEFAQRSGVRAGGQRPTLTGLLVRWLNVVAIAQ